MQCPATFTTHWKGNILHTAKGMTHGWDWVKALILKGAKPHSKCTYCLEFWENLNPEIRLQPEKSHSWSCYTLPSIYVTQCLSNMLKIAKPVCHTEPSPYLIHCSENGLRITQSLRYIVPSQDVTNYPPNALYIAEQIYVINCQVHTLHSTQPRCYKLLTQRVIHCHKNIC